MEASALTHASKRGLLARRSRVLRLTGDEKLIALIRDGHDRAFEALFDRYQSRLLAFCQHMLSSKEDAEDVLQDVFVAAHRAMLADNRRINVRPWLYRIARNRCLNHLRRPVPEGQDTMDVLPHENGASVLERVQNREEFRRLVADVRHLPETQRTALLLREVDAMSYEEIAQAMDTTVPSVKSLLVRARITLAEASQARLLTCGEVQLELAEAAEGLRKASGPVRQHVRSCEGCADFRSQLRSDSKALASLAPIGGLVLLKEALVTKVAGLFGGGGSTAGGGAAAGGCAGAGGAGGAAAGTGMAGAAFSATGAAGAAGGIGGAIGAKAAAGVATAALLTAGAVEVNHYVGTDGSQSQPAASAPVEEPTAAHRHAIAIEPPRDEPKEHATPATTPQPEPQAAPEETTEDPAEPAATESTATGAIPDEDPETGPAGASEVPGTATGNVPATPVGSYTVGTGSVEEAPSQEPPPEDDLPPVQDDSSPPPPPPDY